MPRFAMQRVPEPEVMDESAEVEAYASAAGQSYLEKIDRNGGIDKFMGLQAKKMTLPALPARHPSRKFIKMANQIRGITE